MRRSRFTEEQIAGHRSGARDPRRDGRRCAKEAQVTDMTLFCWRKSFSRLETSQAAELG
jgi:hypothetical protein